MQPASLITDPFAALAQPAQPGNAGSSRTVDNHSGNTPLTLAVPGCAATCPAKSKCQIYSPGYFPNGITVTNAIAYFNPGLYYITSADTNNGFTGGSNSDMEMLNGSTVCPNVANDAVTGAGMVVFNAGAGAFQVGSNGNANLMGPLITNTTYEGILFWEDRTLSTGVQHKLGGGGNLTLTGTIYINMASPTYSSYQWISLNGNSGNTTQIVGEIVTNALQLGGTGGITMTLSPTAVRDVRAVAFVE